MAERYELVGTSNPDTDWTTEVILEVNDDGTTKKSVGAGRPSVLNEEDRKLLESMGYEVRQVSNEEADDMDLKNADVPGATDTAGAAPFLGGSFDDTHMDDDVPDDVKGNPSASADQGSTGSTDNSTNSPKGE